MARRRSRSRSHARNDEDEKTETNEKRGDGAIAAAIRARSGKLISSARKPVRRAVTGHENTRVRDFVKLPRVIRKIDKWSFCAGVGALMTTQYVATSAPEQFWKYYLVCMPMIFLARAAYYRMIRWQYFLYDFCYFANAACFLLHACAPRNVTLFRSIFAFANGPVLVAIPMWRNSLVFHSVDKVQSVFVHAMPCLLTWCGRWYGHGDDVNRLSAADLDSPNLYEGLRDLMVYPILGYLIWQALYLIKTELIDMKKLESDPTLMTSLRWLAGDTKSAQNKMALKLMRYVGFFGDDEMFDATTVKTKFVFIWIQLTYTIVTFMFIPLMYSSKMAHTFAMALAFFSCVYNGAVYYIDVFSRKYLERIAMAEEYERKSAEPRAYGDDSDAIVDDYCELNLPID